MASALQQLPPGPLGDLRASPMAGLQPGAWSLFNNSISYINTITNISE